MKKKLIAIALILITVIAFPSISACYSKQSGRINDIVGTYELERKLVGSEDLIVEHGIREYLVIREEGYGYRVYKDDTMEEPMMYQLKVNFVPDPDNGSRYEYVTYTVDGVGTEERLAFYAREKKLNYGTPEVKSGCIQIESTSESYKKVSDAQDLSYVQTALGVTFSTVPFEYMGYSEPFVAFKFFMGYNGSTGMNSPYIYFIVHFDFNNMTADIAYALEADEQEVMLNDLPVTVQSEGSYKTFTVGDYTFTTYGVYSMGSIFTIGEDQFDVQFSYVRGKTLEEIAQNDMQSYLAQKENQ